MQNLVETLGSLTPVIIIAGLTAFMTLETWRPYFKHSTGRRRQRRRNVGMIAISAALGAALGVLTTLPMAWSEANNFGLLHRILGQSALAVVLGIFVIDLCAYLVHVTLHKVPTLWRIHRVHHADTELDATSGIRLHPFELLLLLGSLAMVLPLLGVSMVSLAVYNTLALPWFLLNHSNMKYPAWFERWGSMLMSTPNWHRVHHSSHQPETDSHYGCVFSLWDRLFGTAGKADVERIQFGLDRFRGPGEQTVWQMLKMPFKEL
jgi:sterol desaturase/sphingolipid hydroxylase (fatty acid hydroxylase superfamily)